MFVKVNKSLLSGVVSSVLLFASLFEMTYASPIIVKKKARAGNPTLIFRGVNGSSKLSKLIASDLKCCGWFELVAGNRADYIITGQRNGTALKLNINGLTQFSVKSRINGADLRRTSHQTVDYILKRLFAINGVCSSKITFCAETKKGIKEIYMCDFDGRNIKQLTRNGTLSVEPDWTPGQRSIVYTMYSHGDTDVVEYHIASRRSRRLAQFPGLNSGGAISPNGNYLSLILSKDRKIELYIKAVNGKGIRRLTKGLAVEASPCWSPDGKKICFVSDSSGRPKLYTISMKGGTPKRLATIGSESVCPSWSTDHKIAYAAKLGRNYTIAVLSLSGQEHSGIVIEMAGDWESPSWSPDNRHLVCSRSYGGKSSLYLIDTWTRKVKVILGGKINFSMPSWSGIR